MKYNLSLAGGFMGDIALPDGEMFPIVAHTPIDDDDEETETEPLSTRLESEPMPADAPVSEVKFNATFQLDLEKLKQEVYNEGLQVEEEGLTDIIRKKTKLPSSNDVRQPTGQPLIKSSSIHTNDASLVSIRNPPVPCPNLHPLTPIIYHRVPTNHSSPMRRRHLILPIRPATRMRY